MPSSIFSSEPGQVDRPTYERPVPVLRFGAAAVVALVLFAGALAAWEMYWRAWGAETGYYNSDGQWAMQRRRIDAGEGNKTVLIGASRVLFDVQLDVWERLSGERPIQLALEGTTPVPVLQELADDPDFTGLLVVGVAPDVFFSGYAYRDPAFKQYREETPAQRSGTWLSMRFVERWFAFFDEDFALMKVLARQAWPARPGVPQYEDVRKLAVTGFDRDTHMWSKVEDDPAYTAMAQRVWAQFFDVPSEGGPAAALKARLEQIDLTVAAVDKLHARGIDVVFVRPPSTGPYLAYEERDFPRAPTWDVLLARTGAPGVHFQDYPAMQGLTLPEWSHLSHADADRYTEALFHAVQAVRTQPAAKGP